MKILVTGSAGFIGGHVYDRLAALGHEVYGIDDLSGGFMRNVSQPDRFTKLDLRNREAAAQYIADLKPEIIFHLAADATEGRSQFTPSSALDRNLLAYSNVLIPAIKYGMKKMILVSSMSVYGKQQVPFRESQEPSPEDVYGITKAAMEKQTEVMSTVYGFPYVIIRPHNVYGPRQNLSDPYRNVIGIFINRLFQGKHFFIYGNGTQKRAFSYIDEVADAMVQSAFVKACEYKIINLGSDEAVTLNQLGTRVLEEFFEGKPIPKKFLPKHVPGRPQEVKYAYCDHTLARKLLKFGAKTDLQTGIRHMIAWARTLGPQQFVYLDSLELDHPKTPQLWKKKLI